MDSQHTVFVFGDQTEHTRKDLSIICQSETGLITRSFLKDSYRTLRREVLEVCSSGLDSHDPFSTWQELIQCRLEGPSMVGLDHALTTVCQLATFLRWCEENDGTYPEPSKTRLVGLCTGALAAIAVSRCHTATQLLPMAVAVVRFSFKVGISAAQTGQRLQSSDYHAKDTTWSIFVPKLLAQAAEETIAQFAMFNVSHDGPLSFFFLLTLQKLPPFLEPYLGVLSPLGVAICGPPLTLSALRSSLHAQGNTCVSLPIYAPYHGKHLYDERELDALVLSCFVAVPVVVSHESIPVVLSDGRCIECSVSLEASFQCALRAITVHTFDWGKVSRSLNESLRRGKAEWLGQARLVSVAGNAATKILSKELGALFSTIGSMYETGMSTSSDANSHHRFSDFRQDQDIAIVGVSGRFPDAANTDKLWQLLRSGLDVHKQVPVARWNIKTHVDTSKHPRKNTSATPFGCWVNEPGSFDAPFFGMSPREAEQTDPAQRLALMTSYEALEDGGIVSGGRSTQPDRVGVIYGVTSNDWMETNSAQTIDAYMIPGGNRAFVPGRINYFFKFSGPSYAIDTACSSSLAAIQLACGILRRQEADTMIAGGTNIITNPDFTAGLDRGRFLSRTGNCKTFDDTADGYCRGEAVGTVILKRLTDAMIDNDSIYGVIMNSETNHSAEAESITRPNIQAQSQLFTRVLDRVDPSMVGYIEMHGTGTRVGDLTEMSSVLDAVAPEGRKGRNPMSIATYLGSLKANIGHGEAAAGVSSLIKLILMMRHNTIPPHVGVKTEINRKFPPNLESRGIHIATEPVPWHSSSSGDQPRIALLNNFSAAGGNTSILLRDAPFKQSTIGRDPRTCLPFTISGKTKQSLWRNVERLLAFVEGQPDICVASLSYTVTARRNHHRHRHAFSASETSEVLSKLQALKHADGSVGPKQPTVVFAYPGQGMQYYNFGRKLYREIATFRADLQAYDSMASRQGFSSFLHVVTASGHKSDTDAIDAVHLLIVCIQLALTRLLRTWGIRPTAVVGHSLGHYAALNASGVLSDAETIFLVGTRARQLRAFCSPYTHSMLSVRASREAIQGHLNSFNVEIACINGEEDFVLSGTRPDIQQIQSRLAEHRIKSKLLDVPFAFHSSQVDSCLDDFEKSASTVRYSPPNIPVICSTSESIVTSAEFGPKHLVNHYRGPVNFLGAIKLAEDTKTIDRDTTFIEIGHGAVLSPMLQRILHRNVAAYPISMNGFDDWRLVSEVLARLYRANANIRWSYFHKDFESWLSVLRLPAYSWDLKDYWIKYENDWSLYKGERFQGAYSPSGVISTTCHSIVRQSLSGSNASLVLRSDLSRPDLQRLAAGHRVDGVSLCTPSLYTDIAITAGAYLQHEVGLDLLQGSVCISDMNIHKALVPRIVGPQWLETAIVIQERGRFSCNFQTVDDHGASLVLHATCQIIFRPRSSEQDLKSSAAPIIERVQAMHANPHCFRFSTGMCYRMVSCLAHFHGPYRAIREVLLDNARMEATSKVLLDPAHVVSTDQFHTNPALLDSLMQSAGFIMNAHEGSDLDRECYVNHGWRMLSIYGRLKPNVLYTTIVCMRRKNDSIWEGTLTILESDRIIAVCEDIQLQHVPRRLLSHVLNTAAKAQRVPEQEIAVHLDHKTHSANGTIASTSSPTVKADPARMDKFMQLVSEETGTSQAELTDDTEFRQLGIDSLMALILADRLKDDCGFDPPLKESLIDRYATIGQLKAAVAASNGLQLSSESSTKSESENIDPSSLSSPPPSMPQAVQTRDEAPTQLWLRPSSDAVPIPGPVHSIILQGADSSFAEGNKINLFFLPDGSGSAMAYAALPRPSPTINLIGLICPFRQRPEAMRCHLDDLMQSYITEIRRRDPSGPYHLAGWSSGGIFAFRIAQMLINEGSTVAKLILIDSPPPVKGLERLPPRFYDHCIKTGLFDQIRAETDSSHSISSTNHAQRSRNMIAHFNATIDLLADFSPDPLSAQVHTVGTNLKAYICWASEYAFDGVRYERFQSEPDDGEGIKFLTERRTDFSANEWAALLPGDVIARVETIDGFDHFGMMIGDGAERLSDFLARAFDHGSYNRP